MLVSFAPMNWRHRYRATVIFASLLVGWPGGGVQLIRVENAAPSLEQRVAQREQAARTTAAANSGDNAWMLVARPATFQVNGAMVSLAGGAGQFMNQLKAVLFTIPLAAIATFILLKLIDAVIGLRVDQEDESLGRDLSQHGERAYNE